MVYKLAFVLLVILPTLISATSPSLLDALKAAGATSFAHDIETTPDLLALYTSSIVGTIFAIPDSCYTNDTLNKRGESPEQQQKLILQASIGVSELADKNPRKNEDTNGHVNVPENNQPAPPPPDDAQKHRRAFDNGTIPSTPLKISSGLAAKVNVLRRAIPYDGGFIHLVDDFFTLPVSASETIKETGLSTLSKLLKRTNLTETFDKTESVTIFAPSNSAFARAGNLTNSTTAQLQEVLNNHMLKGFEGYTPDLKDGATYTTQAGQKVKITIGSDKEIYVNGARIITTNAVLENGVAHIVDSIIWITHVPTTPPPQEYPGAAWSLPSAYGFGAALAVGLAVHYLSDL